MTLPDIGKVRPWADPAVLSINRLPMHTTFASRKRSRVSLNGEWAVRRWAHPELVPADAVGTVDDSAWQRIPVPGNWTLFDLGDLPHYTNVTMPWPGLPPALPEEIPTVVYRRAFDAPKIEAGEAAILHVGAAESVHAVWVNGVFIGYGTDSRLPSEYDVTAALCKGRNEIAIVVCRYSAQSHVEDQDQWWMAGLHREVWVETRPLVHVANVRIGAALNDDGSGLLEVCTTVGRNDGAALSDGWSVRVVLSHGDKVVKTLESVVASDVRPYIFTGHDAVVRARVTRVKPWSAETPHLYDIEVELVDPQGRVVDSVPVRTGFRRIEIREGNFLVNGKRVMIQGVNRHDHHPERGKAVTVDDMRADVLAMKRHNVNMRATNERL